ncbi:MAG: hypothetical protein MMC33_010069 [Icmadophila ericetorum]|nr:hypothetical protein [Icmadophila ericetorum]
MAFNSISNMIYVSKYGSITLLNRTNYATWKPDIQAVLLAANAFDIVTGESTPPAGGERRQDWIKRRGIALNLLYMSTSAEIRNTLTTYLNDCNVIGMWEHLKSLDLSNDAVYSLNLVQAFNLEFFKASETVEAFAQRLIGYQLKLQDTEYKLTDAQMVVKLCVGMPSDSDWAVTRLTVLHDNLTFIQAVAQYQITERLRHASNSNPVTIESANMASNTHNGGRNRGNKRSHRSGIYRGGSPRGNSKHNRGGRHTYSKSSTSGDRCYWCLRKGHIKKGVQGLRKGYGKGTPRQNPR